MNEWKIPPDNDDEMSDEEVSICRLFIADILVQQFMEQRNGKAWRGAWKLSELTVPSTKEISNLAERRECEYVILNISKDGYYLQFITGDALNKEKRV